MVVALASAGLAKRVQWLLPSKSVIGLRPLTLDRLVPGYLTNNITLMPQAGCSNGPAFLILQTARLQSPLRISEKRRLLTPPHEKGEGHTWLYSLVTFNYFLTSSIL